MYVIHVRNLITRVLNNCLRDSGYSTLGLSHGRYDLCKTEIETHFKVSIVNIGTILLADLSWLMKMGL